MNDEFRLLIAKNAATNGRLMCVMLFVTNLVLFATYESAIFACLMVASTAIVGLSRIAETTREIFLQAFFVFVMTALAIAVFVFTLVSILLIG